MNTISILRNIGAYVRNVFGSAFVAQTAGATSAVTGSTVDRLDPANGGLAGSVLFSLLWSTTLAASKTFSINTVLIQHSPDASTWSTLSTPTAPGLLATGSGTVTGVTNFLQDLTDAYRYVRLNWTPTLSNTSTDTLTALTDATLSPSDHLPS